MASISNSALLESIASLEKELNRLKAHLGGEVSAPKEKKKRAVNPDAKPNPWIEFLKRVQPIVKESDIKGPATIGVLFAKSLKASQENAYEMEDAAIAAAFTEWATPENIEHAKSLKKAKKEKDEASESGSVVASEGEAEPKADKPKRVLSEEQKAKMKAGREAAKARKDAEKAAAADGGEAPAEAPAEEPKKEGFKAKAKAKVVEYSISQLQDWNTLTYEGEEYGVNIRGDVINSDGDFEGHWDSASKTLDRKATKPADWDTFN